MRDPMPSPKPNSYISLRLGFSGYQRTEVQKSLVAQNLVSIEDKKTEKGRPYKLKRLIAVGRKKAESLKSQKSPVPLGTKRFGGSDHKALIDEAIQEVQKLGYQYIGEEIGIGSGKLTDLVVEKDGRKVAVECETGSAKADIVTNVRKNLGHFSEFWSVPKDEVIFGRTKKYLETARIDYKVGELGDKKIFKVRCD